MHNKELTREREREREKERFSLESGGGGSPPRRNLRKNKIFDRATVMFQQRCVTAKHEGWWEKSLTNGTEKVMTERATMRSQECH